MYFRVTNGKTFHRNFLQRQMLKTILKSSKSLSEHLFYIQITQFCGFVLWKHLCKQSNHIATILNQKSRDFALIKISAGNLSCDCHVIFANFVIFKTKYRCLSFDIFIKKKLVLAVKVDLIDIDVSVITCNDCYHFGQDISFLSVNHKTTMYFWKRTLPTKAWLCI